MNRCSRALYNKDILNKYNLKLQWQGQWLKYNSQ